MIRTHRAALAGLVAAAVGLTFPAVGRAQDDRSPSATEAVDAVGGRDAADAADAANAADSPRVAYPVGAGEDTDAADATRIVPSDERPIDRLQERMSAELDDLHARGLYPKVGSIVAGSGLAFGVGLRDAHLLRSPVAAEVEAMWSIRGYQRYGAAFGWLERRRDTMELRPADTNITSLFSEPDRRVRGTAAYLSAWYRQSPRVDFYGVGPGGAAPRTDFAVSGTTFDGVVQRQFTETLGLAVRAGLLDFEIGPGSNRDIPNVEERFGPEEAPGLSSQPRYLTAGLAAAADNRDNTDMPTRGGYFGVAVWQLVPVNTDAKSITRIAVDWREYRSIVGDRHVAAVRLLASADRNGRGSQTPFYLQYSLGGSRSLRGFPSYRFRGAALTHLSAEYRWRATRFVEVAAFVDAGAVATGLSRLSRSPFRVTPGIGVRVRTDDRVLLRVDWAHGSEGRRIHFFVGPVF